MRGDATKVALVVRAIDEPLRLALGEANGADHDHADPWRRTERWRCLKHEYQLCPNLQKSPKMRQHRTFCDLRFSSATNPSISGGCAGAHLAPQHIVGNATQAKGKPSRVKKGGAKRSLPGTLNTRARLWKRERKAARNGGQLVWEVRPAWVDLGYENEGMKGGRQLGRTPTLPVPKTSTKRRRSCPSGYRRATIPASISILLVVVASDRRPMRSRALQWPRPPPAGSRPRGMLFSSFFQTSTTSSRH